MLKRNGKMAVAALAVALMVGWTASTEAAIVVEFDTAINDGGAGVGLPLTALSSYDASTASKLVVTISNEDGFGDSPPTGVSFGGTDFDLAVFDTNSIQQVSIYYLDASAVGGTFGTGDLVIQGSGSDDFAGAFLALSGTADGLADWNSSQAASVTIDTTVDGSIVIAAIANNNAGATAQSPLTSVLDSDAGSAGGGAGYAITDPAVSGGTYSFTGSSSRPVTAAVVFEPASVEVPEPASLATGLFGLTLIAARRRKA